MARHVHEAVDRGRKAEHRARQQAGDERLTGTKYLWLMRPRERSPEQRRAFRALRQGELTVARARALKERLRQYRPLGAAQRFFARWCWRATHSRLQPRAEVARLLRRHLPDVLTSLRQGITNAGLEAVDAIIQWVKQTARGFPNPEHFKTAIYFHCGGLDLYPRESR